jgi:hypothetical protein
MHRNDFGDSVSMQRIRSLSDPATQVIAGSFSTRCSLRASNTGCAVALSDAPRRPQVPDALAPFHLASVDERTRRVRDVLGWAWSIYRRGGLSMCDAINAAAEGNAAGEYAKITLRRILLELNLTAWERHPNRTRRDVHGLFRKAINKLGGHRGGWRVSQ